jgi:hypothetical protein
MAEENALNRRIAEQEMAGFPVLKATNEKVMCDSEGFYQHLGECWNDSIQMIFLFTDRIKEVVQPALFDPTFQTKLMSIIEDETNREYFIVSGKEKDEIIEEMKGAAIKYFNILKKRFMRHHMNELNKREHLCDKESNDDHKIFLKMSRISRAAGKNGILAAALGKVSSQKLNRLDVNAELLKVKKEQGLYSSGSDRSDDDYIINLYKLVFFKGFKMYHEVFPKKQIYSSDGYKNDGIFIVLNEPLLQVSLNKADAVLIASHVINPSDKKYGGHATAFYTCGGIELYYDDNSGIYKFPWKKFLNKAIELYKTDKTTRIICGNNKEYKPSLLGGIEQSSSYYPVIRTHVREFQYNNIQYANKVRVNMTYKYYTYIKDSDLLESSDGKFNYSGVSVEMVNIDAFSTDVRFFTGIRFIRHIGSGLNVSKNVQIVDPFKFRHLHEANNYTYFQELLKKNSSSPELMQYLEVYKKAKIPDQSDTVFYLGMIINAYENINNSLVDKLIEIANEKLDNQQLLEFSTRVLNAFDAKGYNHYFAKSTVSLLFTKAAAGKVEIEKALARITDIINRFILNPDIPSFIPLFTSYMNFQLIDKELIKNQLTDWITFLLLVCVGETDYPLYKKSAIDNNIKLEDFINDLLTFAKENVNEDQLIKIKERADYSKRKIQKYEGHTNLTALGNNNPRPASPTNNSQPGSPNNNPRPASPNNPRPASPNKPQGGYRKRRYTRHQRRLTKRITRKK